MPEFTLYGTPTSTATSRVRLTLAEAGFTDYEFVPLNFKDGEHKQPDYLAHNPRGKVPTIVTNDGQTLHESRAICKYLARKYNIPLLPDGSDLSAMAVFEEAESVEMCYFDGAAGKISYEKFVKKFVHGVGPDRDTLDSAVKELGAFFDLCDSDTLSKRGYMGGEGFTLVDVFYVPLVERIISCGFGDLVMSRENVKGWWDRVSSRPAVKGLLDEEPLRNVREQLQG